MAKGTSVTGKAKSLKFSKEQAGWLRDILLDYTVMLKWAQGYYTDEKQNLEIMLKAAETKEAADNVAVLLTELTKGKINVDIASNRRQELEEIVNDFLWIPTVIDVKETPSYWTPVTDSTWDEQVHPTDEDQETVPA